MSVFNINDNNIIINNKMSYNSRKLIKYIDNNIQNINYQNPICFNYIICKNYKLDKLHFCKKNITENIFCGDECKNKFKYNKCQSFIHSIKKNIPIIPICKIFKNNNMSHCSSLCKNNFISKYKIKTENDDTKRASFCIIYKKLNNTLYILVHKRINKLGFLKHQFFIPGGKVEIGETYIDALLREINEETGIDISNYKDNIKILSNINKIMMIFSIYVDDNWGGYLKNDYYEFEKDSYKWIDINAIKLYDNNRNEYLEEYKNYTSLIKILRYINYDIENIYDMSPRGLNNTNIFNNNIIKTTTQKKILNESLLYKDIQSDLSTTASSNNMINNSESDE
tara:strand:+ start:2569 stop:3585 length:1017 start_codon:yes stop_codon:yes gene_type:complete